MVLPPIEALIDTLSRIQWDGHKIPCAFGARPSTPCVEWPGNTVCGYGRIAGIRVHRLIYMALYDIQHLYPDQFICHHCDNKLCCNPHHLFLGDAALNAQDLRRRDSRTCHQWQLQYALQLPSPLTTSG